MELQFLGTSSGTPTKSRNVSAVAVLESRGSRWYLVDCGEGTQHQLLRTKLSLNSLDAICITHVHGDHCYGLPGLLASAGMNGRQEPIKIIAPAGIKEWFEATQAFTQLHLPFELIFIATEQLAEEKIGQFSITKTELSHRVPSFAYSFTEIDVDTILDIEKLKQLNIPRGPIWGTLKSGVDVEYQGDLLLSSDFIKRENKPRKAIICGDNDNPALLISEMEGCNVLVHEATYTEELSQKAGNVGHSYAKLVATFAQEQKIPNLLLTHFSPRYQFESGTKNASISDIQTEAQSEYSGNLWLAEDFQKFRLDKSGSLTLLDS